MDEDNNSIEGIKKFDEENITNISKMDEDNNSIERIKKFDSEKITNKKHCSPSSPRKRGQLRYYFLDNLQTIASQDVVDESNRLYIYLLSGQIARAGLSFPYEDKQYIIVPHNASSFQILANQFIYSPQRKWVYEQAESIDLESLSLDTFQELMHGLFQEGGEMLERVLKVFYFCTDLSIRALQKKVLSIFIRIFNYTTYYISNALSVQVEREGGWEVILQTPPDYTHNFFTLGVLVVGALLVCMYVRSKL